MGRCEVYTVFWWKNLSGRYHLEDLEVGGIIVLKRVFKRYDGGVDLLAVAQDGDKLWGFCECFNERSGSVKCE
jgi:hypothetical protein